MSPAEKLSKSSVKKSSVPAGRTAIWHCHLLPQRKRLGLSLRQVSVGCDVSICVLNCLERGTDPMLTTTVKIAKFFGFTVEQMWPAILQKPVNGARQ